MEKKTMNRKECLNLLEKIRSFPFTEEVTSEEQRKNQVDFILSNQLDGYKMPYKDEDTEQIISNIHLEVEKIYQKIKNELISMINERIDADEPLCSKIENVLKVTGTFFIHFEHIYDSDPYVGELYSQITISKNDGVRDLSSSVPIWTKGAGAPSFGMASHYCQEPIYLFLNISSENEKLRKKYFDLYLNRADYIGEVLYDAIENPANIFEITDIHSVAPCFYGQLNDTEEKTLNSGQTNFYWRDLQKILDEEANQDMSRGIQKIGVVYLGRKPLISSEYLEKTINNLNLRHANFSEMRGLVMKGVVKEGMIAFGTKKECEVKLWGLKYDVVFIHNFGFNTTEKVIYQYKFDHVKVADRYVVKYSKG